MDDDELEALHKEQLEAANRLLLEAAQVAGWRGDLAMIRGKYPDAENHYCRAAMRAGEAGHGAEKRIFLDKAHDAHDRIGANV